ncbi:MAG: helix-turn-helix domain-containing protein [Desulfovibrionaceae bacterium]|nr:helix-turn-helix domain-containing protein [Desulfovibrionaceae bacterium]
MKSEEFLYPKQDIERFKALAADESLKKTQRDRFKIIILYREKHTIKEIVEQLGITRVTVKKWIDRYTRIGEFGLYDTPTGYYGRSDQLPFCNMGPQPISTTVKIANFYISKDKIAYILETKKYEEKNEVYIGNFISNDVNFYNKIDSMADQYQFAWTLNFLVDASMKEDNIEVSDQLTKDMYEFYKKSLLYSNQNKDCSYYLITSSQDIYDMKFPFKSKKFFLETPELIFDKIKEISKKNTPKGYLINHYSLIQYKKHAEDMIKRGLKYSYMWMLNKIYLDTIEN